MGGSGWADEFQSLAEQQAPTLAASIATLQQ
jgi:hypothetical protein